MIKSLADGKHVALDRDHAKRLFRCKDDESFLTFGNSITQELAGTERLFESGEVAEVIHRVLSDGTLEPSAGEYPLNHCVLGGRQLYQSDDHVFVLIRPDMVPHIASAIEELNEQEFQTRFDGIDWGQFSRELSVDDCKNAWACLASLRDLSRRAATARDAVLFFAKCQRIS